ncbi:TetR/AcrR family transcriptional regulator [Ruminococcus sp. CLA-AA-H200]|uniref:TetR/AcrR family transcriptional regulator n=1 Tax=Ruminococcus turbiniformis TaxID=2881258 RepID=A0ABS8FUA9_9FIRM|nr:TetR family transcriptional regulator [Ruminococcus turbiniformis]MCC2253630.1 TetR/AcrR family transcriptional regulator [Ruminococcus turbiniformis]
MPKGSEELTNARKEEIVNACAALYETMSFKDITLRDIGEKTSFTRTSIYNYFQTKEEIFLSLLKQEHDAWIADMDEMIHQNTAMEAEAFAEVLARILEKRSCMLKLMSMNIYDMEVNSRIENLVDFKKSYAEASETLDKCLEKFFPSMTEEDRKEFLYAFFPFLFGVHPYTSHTEKQLEAMRQAGVKGGDCTIYELTKPFLLRLLKSFL